MRQNAEVLGQVYLLKAKDFYILDFIKMSAAHVPHG